MLPTPPSWLSRLYPLLFALLPWSFELRAADKWRLSFPTDLLVAAAALGVAVWALTHPRLALGRVAANRPLLAALALLAWSGIAALFSSMPLVSGKYWLAETAYLTAFGYGIVLWPSLWGRSFRALALSMAAFAVYALAQHANFDFRPDQAALAPRPFFPENTLWGACTAVVLLAHAGTLLGKRPSARDLGIGLALLTAWVSSNSLGAWASLAVAACWWLFGALSGNKRLYLTLGVCLVTSVAAKPMLRVLGSDVSVQERLNRWRCAVEMAGQRPWTGFGPGTYAFQYQPFQRAGSMTRISSEAPLRVGEQAILGRGGGAHSEYARALAETGWPGLALWLLTVVAFLAAAGKASHWSAALACFFLHAWANDFLHDPRMAALVWGGLAYCGAKNKEVWPGLGYSAQS